MPGCPLPGPRPGFFWKIFFFFVCGCLCFCVASIFSCKAIHEARRKLRELITGLFLRVLRPVCLLFLFYRVLCLLYTKCPGCLVVLTRRNSRKWDTCLYSIIPETEVSGPHFENHYIRWYLTSLPTLHSIIMIFKSVLMNS